VSERKRESEKEIGRDASVKKMLRDKIPKREYDNYDRVRFIQITTFLHLSRSFSYNLTKYALQGPVDTALLPTPMRYAAYHLRSYAKKLGAFIHFFMYMHFGKEKETTRN